MSACQLYPPRSANDSRMKRRYVLVKVNNKLINVVDLTPRAIPSVVYHRSTQLENLGTQRQPQGDCNASPGPSGCQASNSNGAKKVAEQMRLKCQHKALWLCAISDGENVHVSNVHLQTRDDLCPCIFFPSQPRPSGLTSYHLFTENSPNKN